MHLPAERERTSQVLRANTVGVMRRFNAERVARRRLRQPFRSPLKSDECSARASEERACARYAMQRRRRGVAATLAPGVAESKDSVHAHLPADYGLECAEMDSGINTALPDDARSALWALCCVAESGSSSEGSDVSLPTARVLCGGGNLRTHAYHEAGSRQLFLPGRDILCTGSARGYAGAQSPKSAVTGGSNAPQDRSLECASSRAPPPEARATGGTPPASAELQQPSLAEPEGT